MLKIKKTDGEKFAFLIEVIPLFLCFELVYMILSKKTQAWDFLQFFSNETQVWYPYSSFWVPLLKGAANEMIILCCFALFILLFRIVNIIGLIKMNKASYILMIVFNSFDLLCVMFAFFTSTNSPGTEYFKSELLDVVGALAVTILIWIYTFIVYRQRKKSATATQVISKSE